MTKQLFSFGIMSDCQYADADDKDINILGTDEYIHNRYRQSPAKLQEVMHAFNQHELAFAVHLGDFVDKDLADVENLLRITDAANAPVWQVLGNHDFLNSEGRVDDVLATFGLTNKYYSKQIQDYRFIILDTNDLGMIEYPEGSPQWQKGKDAYDRAKANGVMNAYPWNGGIDDEQMAWVRQELTDAKVQNQKVIMFSHHPVFPPNVHNALNDTEILKLIDEFDNIVAYMNGHNHLGNFGTRGNVPYLTVNGILEGDTNAYGIVTIFDDHIEVTGYGRLGSYSWPVKGTV